MNNVKNVLVIVGSLVAGLVVGSLFGGKTTVVEKVRDQLGATPGTEFTGPSITINGYEEFSERKSLSKATTTPCVFKSPSATSTIAHANVSINVASTTATTWTLAKANTGFATTTPIAYFSLGSGAQGSLNFVASTTSVDTYSEIKPNTFLVFGMAGVTTDGLTSDKLLGTCSVKFFPH